MGAKGHGSAVGCVERLWKKVLKFDGPCGPKGCGIAHGGHWVARVQRVQKVQKVQKVQRVVVAPFGRRF